MRDSLRKVVDKVQAQFPNTILSVTEFREEVTLRVAKDAWYDVHVFLRDDANARFNFLVDVTAVDYPLRDKRFDAVAHLYSLEYHHRLRTKASVGEDEPIASLVPVWGGANWMERETFDLFGVRYEGHPDLRRIMMPEDWEGYPLRKDYPVEGYDM